VRPRERQLDSASIPGIARDPNFTFLVKSTQTASPDVSAPYTAPAGQREPPAASPGRSALPGTVRDVWLRFATTSARRSARLRGWLARRAPRRRAWQFSASDREMQVRSRLAAGRSRIRTVGTARHDHGSESSLCAFSSPPTKSRREREPETARTPSAFRATNGSNPVPSSGESGTNSSSTLHHLRGRLH
jgi:hypothetical protein